MKRRDVLKALAGLFAAPAIVAKAEPPKETCVCCGKGVTEIVDDDKNVFNLCGECGGLFCPQHGALAGFIAPIQRHQKPIIVGYWAYGICDACMDAECEDDDEESSECSEWSTEEWRQHYKDSGCPVPEHWR